MKSLSLNHLHINFHSPFASFLLLLSLCWLFLFSPSDSHFERHPLPTLTSFFILSFNKHFFVCLCNHKPIIRITKFPLFFLSLSICSIIDPFFAFLSPIHHHYDHHQGSRMWHLNYNLCFGNKCLTFSLDALSIPSLTSLQARFKTSKDAVFSFFLPFVSSHLPDESK